MGDKEKSTSIHNVNFRGKGSTFNEWKIKMLSLARKKKFDMYLLEDGSKTTDKDVAGRQLHERECGCMGLGGTEPKWNLIQLYYRKQTVMCMEHGSYYWTSTEYQARSR